MGRYRLWTMYPLWSNRNGNNNIHSDNNEENRENQNEWYTLQAVLLLRERLRSHTKLIQCRYTKVVKEGKWEGKHVIDVAAISLFRHRRRRCCYPPSQMPPFNDIYFSTEFMALFVQAFWLFVRFFFPRCLPKEKYLTFFKDFGVCIKTYDCLFFCVHRIWVCVAEKLTETRGQNLWFIDSYLILNDCFYFLYSLPCSCHMVDWIFALSMDTYNFK